MPSYKKKRWGEQGVWDVPEQIKPSIPLHPLHYRNFDIEASKPVF